MTFFKDYELMTYNKLKLNQSPLFICYLAAPQQTLGHCQGGSLTNPILITHEFHVKVPLR